MLDGEERYLCDYYLRTGIAQEAEILDEQDASLSLHIKQEIKKGEEYTKILSADHNEFWLVEGEVVLNKEHIPLANIDVSPNSISMFVPDSNHLIVYCKKLKRGSSSLFKLISEKVFRRAEQLHERYQLDFDAWPHNPALLIAIALIKFREASIKPP